MDWIIAHWEWSIEFIGFVLVVAVIRWLICLSCRKPRIEFREPRTAVGHEGNIFTVLIPVINVRLRGWRRRICKRDEAFDCQIKVAFMIEGRLLANTIWWDSLGGETLLPDSSPHEFPLVSVKEEIGSGHEETIIFLEGTHASTASPIPPLKIPPNATIIADVSLTSSSFRGIIKSKWKIAINPSYFSPVGVYRLEDNSNEV